MTVNSNLRYKLLRFIDIYFQFLQEWLIAPIHNQGLGVKLDEILFSVAKKMDTVFAFNEGGLTVKYLKGFVFVLGMMAYGATLPLSKDDHDSVSLAFFCYGLFSMAIMIGWSELKKFIREIRG